MDEGRVDHAVRRVRRRSQDVEIVQSAAPSLRAAGGERRGGLVRTGKADDPVPRVEQVADDGGTDEAGRAGDEYAHEFFPR